jgi:hypothetical protein
MNTNQTATPTKTTKPAPTKPAAAVRKRRRDYATSLPETLPEAGRFSDDPVMGNPTWLVKTLKSLPHVWDDIAEATTVERGQGRPRMDGDWALVYCAYVASKKTAMQSFWKDFGDSSLWQEAGFQADTSRDPGFEYRPHENSLYWRFTELEEERFVAAFDAAADKLIQRARKHDPRIGRDVALDATAYATDAKLHHDCPDPVECAKHGGKNKRSTLDRAEINTIEKTRQNEAETELAPGELPESVAVDGGEDDRYHYYWIGKHRYRTLDKDAGARSYKNGTAWTGGYDQAAVDVFTGGTLASIQAPANKQEFKLFNPLLRKLENTLGEGVIETISGDRGISITPIHRRLTKRGYAAVLPHRKAHASEKDRSQLRTDAYDEYGTPRCKFCGGPGDQHAAKGGLTVVGGVHVIRFRCKLGATPNCITQLQSIRCDLNWKLLVPLSRETERYWALRATQQTVERSFFWRRCRFGGAGKDQTGRLKRLGIGAQRLRAAACRFLEWLYLCLRHGWLGSHKYINKASPVFLRGLRRLRTRKAKRIKLGLERPYGKAALALGLVKPAAPPPDPPPDDDPPF